MKAVLLDQRAGGRNIYADEALWRAKVHRWADDGPGE